MRPNPKVLVPLPLLALAACGGGNAPGAVAENAAVPVQSPVSSTAAPAPSAGGIWHGTSTDGHSLTFFIAEDGMLRAAESPTATLGPALGAGAVLVTGADRISGSYGAKRVPMPPSYASRAETCDFTGTLRERASMSLEIQCIEDGGTGRSALLTMSYNADHAADASLEAIAGNYTLAFREQTNVVTIAADGVVFGLYDNGPSCTVNGLVTVVAPAYNLYRFEWQLSGCQAPLTQYEGAVLTGLATREPRGAPAGSFILILTGIVDAALEGVSVLYERT